MDDSKKFSISHLNNYDFGEERIVVRKKTLRVF